MKIASVSEIKQELAQLPQKELVALCLQLAKYKKDNKELLTYLLFESHDVQAYVDAIKKEMDELFEGVNTVSLYFAKKTLRKILRIANKYIRYTGSKEVEADIRLHFCESLKNSGIRFQKSTALNNIYHAQIKKINAAITTMHEDLQYEYEKRSSKL